MPTTKRPKLATRYTGPRSSDRGAVSFEATCRVGEGAPFPVSVLDLDSSGCRVSGFVAAATKADPVVLSLGPLGPVVARLRWAKRGSAGLKFDEPLGDEQLESARAGAIGLSVSNVVPLRRALSDGET